MTTAYLVLAIYRQRHNALCAQALLRVGHFFLWTETSKYIFETAVAAENNGESVKTIFITMITHGSLSYLALH